MSAPLLWFLLGLAFLAAELLFPALVLLFFGVGAWAAALAALAACGVGVQLVAFMLVSLGALVFFRRRLRAVFGGHSSRTGAAGAQGEAPPAHPLAGQTGVVTRAARPGQVGEISAGGSFWRAESEVALSCGSAVRVLGARPGDTLILRVAPADDTAGPRS